MIIRNPQTLYLHKPFLEQNILVEGMNFYRKHLVVSSVTNCWGKTKTTEKVEYDRDREFIVESILQQPHEYIVKINCLWTQHGDLQDRVYGKEIVLHIRAEDAYYTTEMPFYMDNGKKVLDANGRGFDVIKFYQ